MLRRLFGQDPVEEPVAEAPAAPSVMLSGFSSGAVEEESEVRAPLVGSRPFQAPDSMLGATAGVEYARFNEPDQVPWPGVYTIAEDGVSAEFFLTFDHENGVFVYGELGRNAG